jgi:hypothetical protein
MWIGESKSIAEYCFSRESVCTKLPVEQYERQEKSLGRRTWAGKDKIEGE